MADSLLGQVQDIHDKEHFSNSNSPLSQSGRQSSGSGTVQDSHDKEHFSNSNSPPSQSGRQSSGSGTGVEIKKFIFLGLSRNQNHNLGMFLVIPRSIPNLRHYIFKKIKSDY